MNLLGKATDKDFWLSVREKECFKPFLDELLAEWENKAGDNPRLELKYSEYKLFYVTGDRNVYEHQYFARRRGLAAAAMLSLIYPEEEKYLIRAMDEIFAMCNEFTWAVPAHQRNIENISQVHIDLFAAETGVMLAEIYTILEDRLDFLIKKRIKEEFKRRILDSFIAKTEGFGFETMSNNWSGVCAGSVGCGVMLLYPEYFAEIKPRLDKAIEIYLSGYKSDGFCTEGAAYWNYGFGYFTMYADMLKTFTNGECDYFKLEKVKVIATFIQKMLLTEDIGVSFSDGGKRVRYRLGLVHKLKEIYPDDVLVYDPKYSFAIDGCERFSLHMRCATWLNEEYYYNPADDSVEAEYYAEESMWFVKRCNAYGFAAKAGHNKEPHNHNDVGSFIFAKCGHQILEDIGPGPYNRQYFSGERYQVFQPSSRSHNLPIINGILQSNGIQYSSRDVYYEKGFFTMDISGAYDCPELKALKRSFVTKEDSVILTDEFEYTGEGVITERFITSIKPEIEDDRIIIAEGVVYFDNTVAKPYITEEVTGKGVIYYLINFDIDKDTKSFTITLK